MKKSGFGLLIAIALSTCVIVTGCKRYENPVDMPFAYNEWQKESLTDVVEKLESAGFTNIEKVEKATTNPEKNESVSQITVDGDNLFRRGTRYESTVPVKITYFALKQIDATMEISVSGEPGEPVFEVDTNLPAGVVVSMVLTNDSGYSLEKKSKVSEGKVVSEPFLNNMKKLEGAYQLTVTVKMQDQGSAKYELGSKGECLNGILMREDEETGCRYLITEYNYVSDYTPPEKLGSSEMKNLLEQAAALGFGDDYEVIEDDEGYTVNVWSDGVAATAALANNGYAEPKEQWDTIVEQLRNASISLQNCLNKNGYEDKIAVLNLMNDVNLNYTLATAYNGQILYNCVP